MSNNYKYSLQEPIGQGVFSTTYPAIEVNSQRPVVIKTLSDGLLKQEDAHMLAQRFMDLAQQLGRCHHPHLPNLWECFSEDNVPYVVCDRVIGPTLTEYVSNHGPIPANLALHWIAQVASAVQACHQADMLHLDIHPDNLIYRQEWDDVVLVDVGLTTILSPEIGQTHANLRPPGFAAPEQYDVAARVSPATDVYALSATLYYFLTATAPPPAPLRSHIPTTEWFQLPPDANPALESLLMQGLSLNQDQRPENPDLWLRELNALLHAAATSPALDELSAAVTTATLPPVEPTPEPPRSTKITPLSATTPTKSKPRSPRTPTRPKRPANAVARGRTKTVVRKFPLGALLMTSLIAASAGAGFGLSLRLNRPAGPGSSFWHLEQSFPPKDS
ncbi:MAG: serine/threonine protein kinase [Spirulina sp. SIO3F2]|nr:serine/threonine protein kinase [Spirulina sp. SIO3F2]